MGKVKNILRELFLKTEAISFKYLIVFFLSSISLTAQNATLQLASNNKTIICTANCNDQATGVLNGITYTVYNNSSLANKSISDNDWNRVVTTGVTNMEYLFKDSSFNQDISSWDISNVTSMNGMFASASTFNQNLNNWDVTGIDTDNMFYDANSMDIANYPNGYSS